MTQTSPSARTAADQQDPDAGRAPDAAADPDSHLPKNGMAKASAVMAAGTLLSRVLGFVRTALLAVAIGQTLSLIHI